MQRSTRRILTVVAVLFVVGLVARLVFAEPEQVLLAGDSILRQTGPAVDDSFGRDVDVVNRAVNNSGLLTPGDVDWVERLRRQVDQEDPDVVVLLFIGNYTDTDFWTGEDGDPVLPNTPEFFEAWGHQADRMMEVLEASDAEVYWVLPPPEVTEENQQITAGLRQLYTDLAERWPRVHLIDANDALAGPGGEYLASITNRSGEVVPLRVPDTVHLTDAGARRLARTIHRAIDPSL